jgi:hypothetical protein
MKQLKSSEPLNFTVQQEQKNMFLPNTPKTNYNVHN